MYFFSLQISRLQSPCLFNIFLLNPFGRLGSISTTEADMSLRVRCMSLDLCLVIHIILIRSSVLYAWVYDGSRFYFPSEGRGATLVSYKNSHTWKSSLVFVVGNISLNLWSTCVFFVWIGAYFLDWNNRSQLMFVRHPSATNKEYMKYLLKRTASLFNKRSVIFMAWDFNSW